MSFVLWRGCTLVLVFFPTARDDDVIDFQILDENYVDIGLHPLRLMGGTLHFNAFAYGGFSTTALFSAVRLSRARIICAFNGLGKTYLAESPRWRKAGFRFVDIDRSAYGDRRRTIDAILRAVRDPSVIVLTNEPIDHKDAVILFTPMGYSIRGVDHRGDRRFSKKFKQLCWIWLCSWKRFAKGCVLSTPMKWDAEFDSLSDFLPDILSLPTFDDEDHISLPLPRPIDAWSVAGLYPHQYPYPRSALRITPCDGICDFRVRKMKDIRKAVAHFFALMEVLSVSSPRVLV
jgi:hypothetical protein